MIDPVWEHIHSSRNWVGIPHEEMVSWLLKRYGDLPF